MSLEFQLTVPRFARATDYVGAWAIDHAAAQRLLSVVQTSDLRAHMDEFDSPSPKSKLEFMPTGKGETKFAIVRLDGTLMKAQSSYGGTSTVLAKRDIRDAVNNADVSGILLVIDSPGGTVAGTDELAKEIAAANKRKPVVAFVSDLCASAAYWCASQAEAIYANSDTAWIGSIGTMMTLYDLSKAFAEQGVETIVFGTGPLKGAGTDGAAITDEQRNHFAGLIADSQKSFDAAVKSGRSFSDKQLSSVRSGGVFGAKEAQSLGLIDGIQSLEQSVAALQRLVSERSKQRPAATLPVSQSGEKRVDEQAVIAAQNEAAAKNLERIAGINAVCADHPAVAAQAVREGWTVEKAENAALKAALAKPPATAKPDAVKTSASGRSLDSAVVAAALAATFNRDFAAKHFSADSLNRAEEAYSGGLGLQETLLMAATANGYNGRLSITPGNLREVMQYAFPNRMASGGFTTNSLSGILNNVANKALLEGYQSGEEQWRQIARIGSTNDLKQLTNYRMTGAFKFQPVGKDGELKHGRMGEEAYTNQARTFGILTQITDEDIINDNLGALTQVPVEIGRGAIDTLNEVFWIEFLDNSSFFSSSASGSAGALTAVGPNLTASSALGAAGLTSAKTLFMKQVKADGTPMNLMPACLVVPPELSDTATVLLRDRELRDNTANRVYVAANPHAGSNLTIVTSPYLSNAAYTGNSATSWYLTASPTQAACIEAVFLNGQQSPTIEQSDADFETLGIKMRGVFRFGVRKQDRRGAVKATA